MGIAYQENTVEQQQAKPLTKYSEVGPQWSPVSIAICGIMDVDAHNLMRVVAHMAVVKQDVGQRSRFDNKLTLRSDGAIRRALMR